MEINEIANNIANQIYTETLFVPYDIALKLKEHGFENPCFGGYDKNKKWKWHPDSDIVLDVPTWEQCLRYFRESHVILIVIDYADYNYRWKLIDITACKTEVIDFGLKSYYDACVCAINYCFELIKK